MDTDTTLTAMAVALIAGTLVVSGPMVGAIGLGQSPGPTLDDGTATVDDVALSHSPAVTSGRFGTGVAYLRIPDVTVSLASVTGHPRIVYRVSVPELGVDEVGTHQLRPASRRVTVGTADRALAYSTVRRDRYRATVSVHVQSFAVYRTVFRRNVTVEVTVDD